MGLFDRIASVVSSINQAPLQVTSGAARLAERASQRIQRTAAQVRDHFTHGEGHVLDNVLRNSGNDVVNLGRNTGGRIGAGIGMGLGSLFGGVASVPGRHLGEAAGRALGREVAANIVDGGTGIIQDLASLLPGLRHRGGERHIPNHNTLLERGLQSFAETAIRPFEAAFQAAGIYQPPHRITATEAQALHDNSVAISLDNSGATATHNARLEVIPTQQPL